MDAPCCDVFRLKDGKIQSFNCYPSGTVMLAQLGLLPNLEAAVTQQERHVLNSGASARVAPTETQGEVA